MHARALMHMATDPLRAPKSKLVQQSYRPQQSAHPDVCILCGLARFGAMAVTYVCDRARGAHAGHAT
jgi:hypothetical protein